MATRYYAHHLMRLTDEADSRFHELLSALDTKQLRGNDVVHIDSVRIRLAVDDFKTILTEIRRLK
ncbi:unnamed protein product [marine sediment metagenome]|uniref:Uncharacterized protein n=1 Tax=marine sediment metagenome TaxID=412755 RepID=X1TBW5_9ZZZZ